MYFYLISLLVSESPPKVNLHTFNPQEAPAPMGLPKASNTYEQQPILLTNASKYVFDGLLPDQSAFDAICADPFRDDENCGPKWRYKQPNATEGDKGVYISFYRIPSTIQ